jgi:hypothetical protein
MPLVPDYGKKIFFEENVDVTEALKPDAAYDLGLYHEAGNTGRGVLVVKTILNFKFKEGKSKNGGATLNWTGAEKSNFMSTVRTALTDKWSEKYRLTTASTVPIVKDVGVLFDVDCRMDMSVFSHSHWNLNIVKADAFVTSYVCGGGGSFITNGEVSLDSLDMDWKYGPNTQRGVVHEYGHILGYRDEYTNSTTNAAEDNPHWLTDTTSVINIGEAVRPRHYTLLTSWLNRKWETHARLTRKEIKWKVNGTHDTSNSLI